MSPTDVLIVPATHGLVTVAEQVGLNPRYTAALGIGIAVALSFLHAATLVGWQGSLELGLIEGLSAYGLYHVRGSVKGGA